MTEPEKSTKRRAGAVRRSLLDAAAPVPQQVRHEPPAATPVRVPARETVLTEGRKVKYSMLLDEDESEVFDDLVKRARRQLGRHVDKAKIMRAVIALVADDASLRDQVINEVGRRES